MGGASGGLGVTGADSICAGGGTGVGVTARSSKLTSALVATIGGCKGNSGSRNKWSPWVNPASLTLRRYCSFTNERFPSVSLYFWLLSSFCLSTIVSMMDPIVCFGWTSILMSLSDCLSRTTISNDSLKNLG